MPPDWLIASAGVMSAAKVVTGAIGAVLGGLKSPMGALQLSGNPLEVIEIIQQPGATGEARARRLQRLHRQL